MKINQFFFQTALSLLSVMDFIGFFLEPMDKNQQNWFFLRLFTTVISNDFFLILQLGRLSVRFSIGD